MGHLNVYFLNFFDRLGTHNRFSRISKHPVTPRKYKGYRYPKVYDRKEEVHKYVHC